MKIVLCLPTYNPKKYVEALVAGIKEQSLQPDVFLVIDSSSTDDSIEMLCKAGARVHQIPKTQFNHGGTRNLFTSLEPDGDVYLYLTQDAIPANADAFRFLVKPLLEDAKTGLSYGRQLPQRDAKIFGAHARAFNYPADSRKKNMGDAKELGIKTPFCSDSFSAYRAEALREIGGFPSHTILSEDTYAAAKMLKNGWSIYYAANAQVFHSHDYTMLQEFKRYFDIGVFHRRESWIRDLFGRAEGEGGRYLKSELSYLRRSGKSYQLPAWLMRNGMKFMGYRLGLLEAKLPLGVKKRLSMHRSFW